MKYIYFLVQKRLDALLKNLHVVYANGRKSKEINSNEFDVFL